MRERIIRELRQRGGAVDVRSRALDGDPRSPRRHPDQHHRRVLPVAAARVPARSGPRSRLRHGRRDRSAAARRPVARHVARDLHRPGEARAGPGAGARAARADPHARGARLPAAAAARRVGRARPLPGARPAGSRRRRRLPPRGRRARSISFATAVARRARDASWRKGRCASRATSCSRRISGGSTSFRDGGQRRGPRAAEPRRARTSSRPTASRARATGFIPTRTTTIRARTAGKRHRQEALPARRRRSSTSCARFSRDLNVVLARGIRKHVRDCARAVPDGAQRAIAARLLRRAAARRRAARADGRVLAEPLPPRGALPPRPRRRVPGHQPQAVGADLAAGEVMGRRDRPRRRSPSIFIVGDRKQSIYRFRDADVAVLQEAGGLHRRAAPGLDRAPLDRAQLPRGAGAARVRQRPLRRDGPARAPRRRLQVRPG